VIEGIKELTYDVQAAVVEGLSELKLKLIKL
jgi:hypothetical protein